MRQKKQQSMAKLLQQGHDGSLLGKVCFGLHYWQPGLAHVDTNASASRGGAIESFVVHLTFLNQPKRLYHLIQTTYCFTCAAAVAILQAGLRGW